MRRGKSCAPRSTRTGSASASRSVTARRWATAGRSSRAPADEPHQQEQLSERRDEEGRMYRPQEQVEAPRGDDVADEVDHKGEDCCHEEAAVRGEVLGGLCRVVGDQKPGDDLEVR